MDIKNEIDENIRQLESDFEKNFKNVPINVNGNIFHNEIKTKSDSNKDTVSEKVINIVDNSAYTKAFKQKQKEISKLKSVELLSQIFVLAFVEYGYESSNKFDDNLIKEKSLKLGRLLEKYLKIK